MGIQVVRNLGLRSWNCKDATRFQHHKHVESRAIAAAESRRGQKSVALRASRMDFDRWPEEFWGVLNRRAAHALNRSEPRHREESHRMTARRVRRLDVADVLLRVSVPLWLPNRLGGLERRR